MDTSTTRPLDQESSLVEAVALLEAGRAQEALSVLDQSFMRKQDKLPSDHPPLAMSLARSVRAHALADLDQGQQALECLEEALSLVDPQTWLMERVWHVVASVRAGVADRSLLPPLPGSFQDLLDTLPPEATNPALLCCKAEALYVYHEFEAAQSLLGFACVLDAWRGQHTLPRVYFANNCALASFKAGDCDLALNLSAAAVECLDPGSPLAAPLCYNRAALLWELTRQDEATPLYNRVLACDVSDGRACLAQALAAEKLGVPAPPFAHEAQVERQRATHDTLYDTERFLAEEEEPCIWIPIFAAWFSQRAIRMH